MLTLIIFILILSALVMSHEFGHFIVAKRAGMRVDEFGFGFPPRIFGWKRGETLYSINLIPFGGFVKIYGEDGDEGGVDKDKKFTSKRKMDQGAVILAGVVFNFILAWALFSAGFMIGFPVAADSATTGTLRDEKVIITHILPSSPAERAGLILGDSVQSLSYGNEEIIPLRGDEVSDFIRKIPRGESVELTYMRGDAVTDVTLIPEDTIAEENRVIGIGMDVIGFLELPAHKALYEGGKRTVTMTALVVESLYELLKKTVDGEASLESVSGPIGIYMIVGEAHMLGLSYLISLTALLSVTLGVMNLIPFPALDGGRFLFLLIEALKGSPIKPKIANAINFVGFAALILLMLVISYGDLAKFGFFS